MRLWSRLRYQRQIASSSHPDAPADNLIDASPSYPAVTNTGSTWNSGATWNNDWIKLDLGTEKTFSEIRLLPRSTPSGDVSWDILASIDDITYFSISSGSSFAGDGAYNGAIYEDSEWGITNDFGAVSYRYIKINLNSPWNNGWVSVYEIEVWNNVVFQAPEFSTYIYLATLAFTFAIGYRRILELMREKN